MEHGRQQRRRGRRIARQHSRLRRAMSWCMRCGARQTSCGAAARSVPPHEGGVHSRMAFPSALPRDAPSDPGSTRCRSSSMTRWRHRLRQLRRPVLRERREASLPPPPPASAPLCAAPCGPRACPAQAWRQAQAGAALRTRERAPDAPGSCLCRFCRQSAAGPHPQSRKRPMSSAAARMPGDAACAAASSHASARRGSTRRVSEA